MQEKAIFAIVDAMSKLPDDNIPVSQVLCEMQYLAMQHEGPNLSCFREGPVRDGMMVLILFAIQCAMSINKPLDNDFVSLMISLHSAEDWLFSIQAFGKSRRWLSFFLFLFCDSFCFLFFVVCCSPFNAMRSCPKLQRIVIILRILIGTKSTPNRHLFGNSSTCRFLCLPILFSASSWETTPNFWLRPKPPRRRPNRPKRRGLCLSI